MNRYEKLTKFIPALSKNSLGEWVVQNGLPRVEYWDVVFRFCDAVEAFCEENPDFTEFPPEDADEAHRTVGKLLHAVRAECAQPGLLYGYLANGTVIDWLKTLEKQEA